jgi:hypothetical protein
MNNQDSPEKTITRELSQCNLPSSFQVTPESMPSKTANRPRSNTCPIIQSPTQSRRLVLGSRVIILGTENVEQRAPQYVGLEAMIVDVPGQINPITICF